MNSTEMRKNLESDIQNLNGLILENKPNDEIAKLLHGVSENVSKLNLMVMRNFPCCGHLISPCTTQLWPWK